MSLFFFFIEVTLVHNSIYASGAQHDNWGCLLMEEMPASLNKYLANLQVDEEELPRYFSVTENDSCSHGKVTWFQACLMPVETSRGVSCPQKRGAISEGDCRCNDQPPGCCL